VEHDKGGRSGKKRVHKKKKFKKRTSVNYGILGIILAVLAALIFLFLLVYQRGITEKPSEEPVTEEPVIIEEKPLEPEKPPAEKYSLYLVIDDVGYSLDYLEVFLAFPGKITFAVLPGLANTVSSAWRIQEAGRTVILHQPMEPLGPEDPGTGAILSGMTRQEVFEVLEENLAQVPGAVGLNNHMGSKVTAEEETMRYILEFCAEKGLIFLDSRTTPLNPVGEKIAEELGVKYMYRDSAFLDNDKNKESIVKAFSLGLDLAKRKGKAVMIGHVTSSELAETLLELYPSLIEDGYTFEEISEYIFRKESYEGSGN